MMSKTTTLGSMTATGSDDGAKSFLTRMIETMQTTQQTRADRIVRPYLARASVSDLAALGFTSREITDIKRDRHMPVVTWY